MLNRKWTLITLGGFVVMVILGTFLKTRSNPIAAKDLMQKAEHLVRSIQKKTTAAAPISTANQTTAEAPGKDSNPYADWDKDRLEKEVTEQNAVDRLNRKDLPADERKDLTHLILALQDSREAWIKEQVAQIENAVKQAEQEQAQKLADTKEKLLNARQVP